MLNPVLCGEYIKINRGDFILINHEHLAELNFQINELRHLLISTGTSRGLGCMETLKYSEELDKLIIQIQLHNRC
ncbi:Spo0E family sporulation regulatory protein-aspartic acid phosphatase [Domibacillus mangrovi]|uniref:Spo0E family sporulation regulatory protein-aspartic acid phosphatase n=1 Tax=Domibacillus mangrovi TaxID=1714354 RepID=UPI0009FB0E9C